MKTTIVAQDPVDQALAAARARIRRRELDLVDNPTLGGRVILAQEHHAARVYREADRKLFWPAVPAIMVLLVGLYYLPALLGGTVVFDLPFMVVAAAWCGYGLYGCYKLFGPSLWIVVMLFVLPYYLVGPVLYLWSQRVELWGSQIQYRQSKGAR